MSNELRLVGNTVEIGGIPVAEIREDAPPSLVAEFEALLEDAPDAALYRHMLEENGISPWPNEYV